MHLLSFAISAAITKKCLKGSVQSRGGGGGMSARGGEGYLLLPPLYQSLPPPPSISIPAPPPPLYQSPPPLLYQSLPLPPPPPPPTFSLLKDPLRRGEPKDKVTFFSEVPLYRVHSGSPQERCYYYRAAVTKQCVFRC